MKLRVLGKGVDLKWRIRGCKNLELIDGWKIFPVVLLATFQRKSLKSSGLSKLAWVRFWSTPAVSASNQCFIPKLVCHSQSEVTGT